MQAALMTRVRTLIDAHQLHARRDGPVDLGDLEESYVPSYAPLRHAGILGLAMPPLHGAEASVETPAAIVLDTHLEGADKRLVYAHEVGHVLCGHAGSLFVAGVSGLWHAKQEAQAWAMAAMLLVPIDAFEEGETVYDVAARCEVPVELIYQHPMLR